MATGRKHGNSSIAAKTILLTLISVATDATTLEAGGGLVTCIETKGVRVAVSGHNNGRGLHLHLHLHHPSVVGSTRAMGSVTVCSRFGALGTGRRCVLYFRTKKEKGTCKITVPMKWTLIISHRAKDPFVVGIRVACRPSWKGSL